ncbi:Tat pathway signal sequence domain protein [Streptomyces sp. NPDC002734]|uniref:Tat pathway signal sequence domain protein n=1 Tax=Streptomyces sp. NPDC002734 TaxID=3154426 RepID=UPI003321D22D
MRSRRTTVFATVTVTTALVGAASLWGVSATAAAAPTTLAVLTHANGSSVPVTSLSAPLASGTTAKLTTTAGGTTGVTCATAGFAADVAGNPAAPGTATENNVRQTFAPASCTSTILGTTGVSSITVSSPLTASVTSGGAVTVNGPITATAVLKSVFGNVTCAYSAPRLDGTANNADHSLSFTDQVFAKGSGSTTCPSTIHFTAKYAPVSGPDGPVVVN